MRSAILFILLWRCLTAQEAAGIEGLAIDAVTRLPIAGVHITMRTASPDAIASDTYGAISRNDGHFSIAGMPPALYFVAAQHNGYVYTSSDAGVTLKPGERRTEFTVELTPRASIAGRVVDEYGDPLQHVEVSAVQAASGSRIGQSGMNGRTDERGQFRMTGAPGKYYVMAEAGREMAFGIPEIRTDGVGPPNYGKTYFPGSESKDRASVVEVAAGRDLTGIDIHLTRRRSLTISGAVIGTPENAPPAMIMLQSDEGGTQEFPAGSGGKFTIPILTPGHYRLLARHQSGDVILQSRAIDLELDAADRSGLSLTLEKGETITGTVEIQGGPAENLTVRLEGEGNDDIAQRRAGEVDREGAFRIERVFPEKFRVRVLPLPENGFVKSVKVDNVETNDDVLDLSQGGSADIKITVGRNGGRVEGRVLGEDGESSHLPFAFVFMAAKAEEINDRHLNFVNAGTKFQYGGLRPGKYRLMAIDPRQIEGDFAGVKAMFAKAPEIEIREGDRITKDVKIMTAENTVAKP